MRLLVIGDYISDVYTFGTATRICPEGPVPIISYKGNYDTHSDGGAGLVFNQLKELGADVSNYYGSYSTKHRIFADKHLICRLDCDSHDIPKPVMFDLDGIDAIVVSDYGKGALTEELAAKIRKTRKPLFVDSKHHWDWYIQSYSPSDPEPRLPVTLFPNEHEQVVGPAGYVYEPNIVLKMGAKGCKMGDLELPATVSEVVDVTGAGDIFMAGFVYAWTLQLPAEDCLRFANALAGESCRHVGTFVVGREFAQAELDRLRASKVSPQPLPDCSPGSIESAFRQLAPSAQWSATEYEKANSQLADCEQGPAAYSENRRNSLDEQTLLESPSVPTVPTDAPLPSDQESSDEQDRRLR